MKGYSRRGRWREEVLVVVPGDMELMIERVQLCVFSSRLTSDVTVPVCSLLPTNAKWHSSVWAHLIDLITPI